MNRKDMCESCLQPPVMTYLSARLCRVCVNRVQEYRFDGGPKTPAVKSFEKKHPFEFKHGCTEEYHKEKSHG